MSEEGRSGSSRNAQFIRAPREAVYRAFLEPRALETWLAPDAMTGKVHELDARVGGGYRMSLYYAPEETAQRGKTTEREDRFQARFVELSPPRRIVQLVNFDSPDPVFSGEMSMIATLESKGDGTEVTLVFENIPPGIRPEDNVAGTRSSLEKLARLLEAD